jgi:penicillin amidase
MGTRLAACIGISLIVSGCGNSAPPGNAGADGVNRPVVKALTSLPPGQSGFFTALGQVQYLITGNPADFGPHVDDQRIPYYSFEYKDGAFLPQEGSFDEPRPGVKIYRSAFGVPAIYADSVFDLWYGVGYAIAQDRMFEMDGVRRLGRGTLAELAGAGSVPADVQQRVLTYSESELQAMYEGLAPDPKASIDGYIAGANAWIDELTLDPQKLPAEYALLSSLPQKFTPADVIAGGVLITRQVASLGGYEMHNVRDLRELEAQHGAQAGREIFQDMLASGDTKAVTTVPPEEATFEDSLTPPDQVVPVFNAMADFAATLPLELNDGPGTGAYPAPPGLLIAKSGRTIASVGESLEAFRARVRGGSFSVAIAPSRTADGSVLLMSEPQLAASYPGLLCEFEIHGAGYDAKGASVPLLPAVGLGRGKRIAWALTTGDSKTIDSFIETVRVEAGTPQHFHNGQWKDQDCRNEVVSYRASTQGAPAGPALQSVTVPVCRTAHGPIVATSNDGTLARSVQFAMYGREFETVNGVQAWNRVGTLAEFREAMKQVTWNENTIYADADGNIAYYHPGLHYYRDPRVDPRLPIPGTGEYDHRGLIPFEQLPHIENPARGWLANWNNLPAIGWGEGIGGEAILMPASSNNRVSNLFEVLAVKDDFTFEQLRDLDMHAGLTDMRARTFLPLLLNLSGRPDLSPAAQQALTLLAGWDRRFWPDGLDLNDASALDTAAATIFDAFVFKLRAQLFGEVLPESFIARLVDVGSHRYDQALLDSLTLRALAPETSSLVFKHDYLGETAPAEFVKQGLEAALVDLAQQYGSADPATYRRVHHRRNYPSLTGVVGPELDMPFQDRGAWVQFVGFLPE